MRNEMIKRRLEMAKERATLRARDQNLGGKHSADRLSPNQARIEADKSLTCAFIACGQGAPLAKELEEFFLEFRQCHFCRTEFPENMAHPFTLAGGVGAYCCDGCATTKVEVSRLTSNYQKPLF